ncbi:hypothetical protein EV182_008236, partial [Spiromyces aspiralis]
MSQPSRPTSSATASPTPTAGTPSTLIEATAGTTTATDITTNGAIATQAPHPSRGSPSLSSFRGSITATTGTMIRPAAQAGGIERRARSNTSPPIPTSLSSLASPHSSTIPSTSARRKHQQHISTTPIRHRRESSRRLSSVVWGEDGFERLESGVSQCKVCGKEYSKGSSTGTLKRHYETHQPGG